MPQDLNNPKKVITSIKEIWYGKEIDHVRNHHLSGKIDELNICKNCTFKDTYDWIE